MSIKSRLKAAAGSLKREFRAYQLLATDGRTPLLPRVLLGLAVGYTMLPFDIIPDFVPILGQLDDLVVVPALLVLALRLVPPALVEECRARASQAGSSPGEL